MHQSRRFSCHSWNVRAYRGGWKRSFASIRPARPSLRFGNEISGSYSYCSSAIARKASPESRSSVTFTYHWSDRYGSITACERYECPTLCLYGLIASTSPRALNSWTTFTRASSRDSPTNTAPPLSSSGSSHPCLSEIDASGPITLITFRSCR